MNVSCLPRSHSQTHELLCNIQLHSGVWADLFRWIGVAVAVVGLVLSTPEGVAALWHETKNRDHKIWALTRRLLKCAETANSVNLTTLSKPSSDGNAYVDAWPAWHQNVRHNKRIDILHQQVDFLYKAIGELRTKIDCLSIDLQHVIRQTEDRIMKEIRDLKAEIHGDQKLASQVDARGFGPVAIGIILTGLPDELSTITVIGWIFVVFAIGWIAVVVPDWWKVFRSTRAA